MPNRAEQLQLRLAIFAAQVDVLVNRLPRDFGGVHLARQLTRSSTSPIANYGEASEAESAADYVHKMKICLKELRETRGWIVYSRVRAGGSLNTTALEKECSELVAIFVTCVKKASAKK